MVEKYYPCIQVKHLLNVLFIHCTKLDRVLYHNFIHDFKMQFHLSVRSDYDFSLYVLPTQSVIFCIDKAK